jgi:hypothetical protein
MTSQSAPIEILDKALNAYDNNTFINEDNSLQKHEGGSTRRPAFLPAEDPGFDFEPF